MTDCCESDLIKCVERAIVAQVVQLYPLLFPKSARNCPEPGCSETGSLHKIVLHWIRKHKRVSPACPLCGVEVAGLRLHLENVHHNLTQQYGCDFHMPGELSTCDAVYDDKDTMRQHIRDMHGHRMNRRDHRACMRFVKLVPRPQKTVAHFISSRTYRCASMPACNFEGSKFQVLEHYCKEHFLLPLQVQVQVQDIEPVPEIPALPLGTWEDTKIESESLPPLFGVEYSELAFDTALEDADPYVDGKEQSQAGVEIDYDAWHPAAVDATGSSSSSSSAATAAAAAGVYATSSSELYLGSIPSFADAFEF